MDPMIYLTILWFNVISLLPKAVPQKWSNRYLYCTGHHFHPLCNPFQILWTFSIYLEAVAILPQLFMVSKTGEAESITSHYLFALGSYRALYIINWVSSSFLQLISLILLGKVTHFSYNELLIFWLELMIVCCWTNITAIGWEFIFYLFSIVIKTLL